MPSAKKIHLIIRLPDNSTRREFKAACAARGLTMRQFVLAAIQREIKRARKGIP